MNPNTEFIEEKTYDGNGRLEYWGMAEPGTKLSTAKWRIIRFRYSSGGDETSRRYATGTSDLIHSFKRRASYNYS